MPRHWGLGIYKNDEWTFSGLPSTDAVALVTDFNAFDIGLYYEKFAESRWYFLDWKEMPLRLRRV